MTALMGPDVQVQEPEQAPDLREQAEVGGDVILARWLAVGFTVIGVVALLATQGRWGLAGLIVAGLALAYAQAAAWADRREAGRRLSR